MLSNAIMIALYHALLSMSSETQNSHFSTSTVLADPFLKMYMPTAIRRKILRYLFENGVLCVSDNQSAVHDELQCLNIYPYQLGRSFVSKGLCKKSYAWAHAYYTLTDKGIEYLRGYFGLPANAAPKTLQAAEAKVLESSRPRRSGPRGPRGGPRGERPAGGRFSRRPQREEAPAESQ